MIATTTTVMMIFQKLLSSLEGSIVFTAGIRNEMHALTEESFHFNKKTSTFYKIKYLP